ncbi:amidase family protein [Cumulibacter manganitolerans]|uniref:amidase family protein n=1 Tax=Cumulibacter manganitolerans TaxID=1884992 RepID=UPI00129648F8|nr:amidase family protein [Cumulibacter manganitolerans]
MSEIKNLADRIAGGELTAVQATQEAIDRIVARDDEINAVVVRDFDRALDAARQADDRLAAGERAPMLGVPMTVKESYDVAGLPTTWGFAEHRDHIATADARAVRRLKEAGAIIVGKTNVPPALADFLSVNPVYGATHNPHRHGLSSGGSSGGSAASLAAGYVCAEIGSDIGGSIRIPAAFCGVWGLKPTFGLVGREGHWWPGTDGGELNLSVAGPLARTSEDLALLLEIIADHPLPMPRRTSPEGARIAVITEHPVAKISADVSRVLDEQCARLEASGATVDRAPQLPDLAATHRDYVKMLLTVLSRGNAPEGVTPVTLSAWFDMIDQQARTSRAWNAALTDEYDAVLAPVFGSTAFPLDEVTMDHRTVDIDGEQTPCGAQLAWAGLATYPNLPSVCLPAGTGSDGLPIGLQLIGRQYAEPELLAIAAGSAPGRTSA